MKIQIDYQKALKAAGNIEMLSSELRLLQARLQKALNELETGWKGEAASAFDKSFIQALQQIQRRAREVENLSETIREVTLKIKKTDDEVRNRASSAW